MSLTGFKTYRADPSRYTDEPSEIPVSILKKRRHQENAYEDEEVQSWEGDGDDAYDHEAANYDDYNGVADSDDAYDHDEEKDYDDYDGIADGGSCGYEEEDM